MYYVTRAFLDVHDLAAFTYTKTQNLTNCIDERTVKIAKAIVLVAQLAVTSKFLGAPDLVAFSYTTTRNLLNSVNERIVKIAKAIVLTAKWSVKCAFLGVHDLVAFSYTTTQKLLNSVVDERIGKVVKAVVLVRAMKSNLNLAAIGTLFGLSFPQFCGEKLKLIWASIFNPKTREPEDNKEYSEVELAWMNIENAFIRITPLAFAGSLGFMVLPTVTHPASAILAGIVAGAYFGNNAKI